MTRLTLERNTLFTRFSILCITRSIVLFDILSIKLFTLWVNDVNVSSVMFLLIASFRIYMFTKWKTFSIGFKSGLQGGMQKTKAPISSRTSFMATEFWMGHPSWTNRFASWVGTSFKHRREMLMCYIRHCATW